MATIVKGVAVPGTSSGVLYTVPSNKQAKIVEVSGVTTTLRTFTVNDGTNSATLRFQFNSTTNIYDDGGVKTSIYLEAGHTIEDSTSSALWLSIIEEDI